jgi:hypothetical protein
VRPFGLCLVATFPKLAKRFGNALFPLETLFPGRCQRSPRAAGAGGWTEDRETEFPADGGIPKALR